MLHVQVHEADLVLLEVAVQLAGAVGRGEAIEPFRLEDAVDRIPVQVRQEVGDDEGEVVERKAGGAAERADDGALLIAGFPRQLVRPGRAVLTVGGSALAPICGWSRWRRRSGSPACRSSPASGRSRRGQ